MTGHRGSRTKCLKLSNFDDYQRAECLTRAEVVARSNNSVTCADSCRNYCFLSCMAERHEVSSGTVDAECTCTPSKEIDNTTGLQSWCFTAQGDCAFFGECLSCNNSLETTQRLQCQWFSNNLLSYENCTTREWIREVRVCFQNYYISHISTSPATNCSQIEQAFYHPSFYQCLRMSTTSSADFCSLTESDRSTIYSGLTSVYDATLQLNINGTLTWMNMCW